MYGITILSNLQSVGAHTVYYGSYNFFAHHI